MEDKVALVTGCSSGLGTEISNYLLDEGYLVIGCSRSGVEISHGNFIDVITDVRDERSVEELFVVVRETTDQLHLIVNCAGVCQMSPLEEMSTREFTEHLDANVLGAFHLLKHCSNFLVENHSHIINVSILGSAEGLSAFSASKNALNTLIDCCRKEWKDKGVRFSTLIPGQVDTPLWKRMNVQLVENNSLKIVDFLYIFEMVINSPPHIHFPKVCFGHMNESNIF